MTARRAPGRATLRLLLVQVGDPLGRKIPPSPVQRAGLTPEQEFRAA